MWTQMFLKRSPTILPWPRVVHPGLGQEATITGVGIRNRSWTVQGIGDGPRRKVVPPSPMHAPNTCYLQRARLEENGLQFWPDLLLQRAVTRTRTPRMTMIRPILSQGHPATTKPWVWVTVPVLASST